MLSTRPASPARHLRLLTKAPDCPRRNRIAKWQCLFLATSLFAVAIAKAETRAGWVSGSVLDPSGLPVVAASVQVDSAQGPRLAVKTGSEGTFSLHLPASGMYSVRVEAPGFAPIVRTMQLNAGMTNLTLRLQTVTAANQAIVVAADVSKIEIAFPDPSQKMLVREELLDANPGRPGAPISIPGLPIETASGGIKAPQYFAPGVAGDHGEPIAQYIAIGGFLVPNNLSANAHGNGYADPNIYVSGVLGSVATDGGAYNVLEGNHSLNLAASYGLRPQLHRFFTLTGDYRDIDLMVGLAPADETKREWLALEANYGNGLLRRLEHRQQYKWNGLRAFDAGSHEITLFAIGYYGNSHEGNLVPVGSGVQVNDTVDPRQQDQTHTFLFAANDQWKAAQNDEAAFSGYFRTYNLTLFSDFGEGLIRQSEFRFVEGGEARETHTFAPWLEAIAGVLYNEDDIRNDNLDHYLSDSPSQSGPFVKVLANDVTIREFAPYIALHGTLGKHLQVYGGLRNDQIQFINTDKMTADNSFNEWSRFENPKATITWFPGSGPDRWLPSASLSLGQAFFTEDPRTNVAASAPGSGAVLFCKPAGALPRLSTCVRKELPEDRCTSNPQPNHNHGDSCENRSR
jgi:hypothetical protein